MRRFIISFVSIIILYVLQCTVFKGALLVAGVAPNLMLMFTCIVGFMRGRKSGMITGFARRYVNRYHERRNDRFYAASLSACRILQRYVLQGIHQRTDAAPDKSGCHV